MHRDSLPIPPHSLLLGFKFLEIHEAALWLSGVWPDHLVLAAVPSVIAERVSRYTIYTPKIGIPSGRASRVVFLRDLILRMKKAIEKGELLTVATSPFLTSQYGEKKVYFVQTREIIVWALLNEIPLSEELSQEIGLFQIKERGSKNNIHRKIRNQIIGQFILSLNATFNVTNICNHGFMTEFGAFSSSKGGERKAIRRAIDQLFDTEGAPGRPSKEGNGTYRCYSPKALSDVMVQDADGKARYRFPLLKTALSTAVEVKVKIIGWDCFLEMTEEQFLQELLLDSVMKMYTAGARIELLPIAMQFILERLRQFYPHPKIALIPGEIQRQLLIRQFLKKNEEFCLEPFTEEEKSLIRCDSNTKK